MLMGSKLRGVPVSAAEAVVPPAMAALSSGIRAPLTMDDDDDDSGSEYSVKSAIDRKDTAFSSCESESNGGLESDGSLSGEEVFDNGSERTNWTGPDDKIVKDSNFVKDCVVSRPSVRIPLEESDFVYSSGEDVEDSGPSLKIPLEENVDASSSDGDIEDSRPSVKIPPEEEVDGVSSPDGDVEDSRSFLRIPDGGIVEENVVVEECNNRMPFLADTSEEAVAVATSIEVDDDDNATLVLPTIDDTDAFMDRQGMPVAKLSGNSDDDCESKTSLEDEPFSGVEKASSSGDVNRLISAPKVRALEVGDGDDSASLSDFGSQAESVEDSDLVGGENGFPDSFVEDKKADELISAEVVEDDGPFTAEEARGAESCNEIQELTRADGVDFCDDTKDPDLITDEETKVNGNTLGTVGVGEAGQVLHSEVPEVKVIESEAIDCFCEESMDYGNSANKSVDSHGTVLRSELDDAEDLASVVELVDHSSDFASDIEHKIDDNHIAPLNLESTDNIALENDAQLMNNVKPPDSQMAQVSLDVTSEESSESHMRAYDAAVVKDSRDEPNAHSHGVGQNIYNSVTLEELLRAASVMFTSSNSNVHFPPKQFFGSESRVLSLRHPAQARQGPFPSGPESRVLSLRPPAQARQGPFPSGPMNNGESVEVLSDEDKMKLEKLQGIGVKFLRLIHRLHRSPEDSIAAKVLQQLQLAAGRLSTQAFNLDFARQAALILEGGEVEDELEFSLNVLVIGKTGVGKSATINTIFGEDKSRIDAFKPGTTGVKEIIGTLDGVRIRVLDTAGLRPSHEEQSFNYKVVSSIKKFMQKFPPDVVLYVDRLDARTGELDDWHLLKLITSSLGSSIWYKTIITLTHAATTPPEGPSGYPLSYNMFVAKRSLVVEQSISHSIGNSDILRPSPIPVSLIENSFDGGMDQNELTFFPSKESWRSQLLLLCYSIKILAEISSVFKANRAAADYRKLFGFKIPSVSLPHFVSSLLHPNSHPKLATVDGIENFDSDIELAYSSECDQESEDEYDQLPPFKPLKKSVIAKLSKEHRNAYFDEYDYRVKLLQKKQLKERVKMFRDAKKKRKEGAKNNPHMEEEEDDGTNMDRPDLVDAAQPDRELPPSFDGENPSYRYRGSKFSWRFLAEPALDLHGWDHDSGYDGVNMEGNLAVLSRFPAAISVSLKKDKNEFNIHLNSAASMIHGDTGSFMLGFNVETLGRQLAYILKTETKLQNMKVNKTAAGVCITFVGKNVVSGLKLEDELTLGKNLVLVGSSGVVRSEDQTAYGANLRVRIRDKDYPIGQGRTELGLSLTRSRKQLAWGLSLDSQFLVRRNMMMNVRAGLNGQRSGVVSVRINSSDQPLVGALGLLPIAQAMCRSLFMHLNQRWKDH